MHGRHLSAFMPQEVVASRLAAINRVAGNGQAEHMIDQREGRTYRQTFYPVAGESDRVVVYAADIT